MSDSLKGSPTQSTQSPSKPEDSAAFDSALKWSPSASCATRSKLVKHLFQWERGRACPRGSCSLNLCGKELLKLKTSLTRWRTNTEKKTSKSCAGGWALCSIRSVPAAAMQTR